MIRLPGEQEFRNLHSEYDRSTGTSRIIAQYDSFIISDCQHVAFRIIPVTQRVHNPESLPMSTIEVGYGVWPHGDWGHGEGT